MAVSASQVKELRERTGLGMMECKQALVDAEGDIEQAIENLRKSGQAKAAKKAGRTAAEGAIVVSVSDDARHATMVEINSETDFVARDDNFVDFANKVARATLNNDARDADQILALTLEDGRGVEEARQELVQKIGENIQVRRAVQLQAPEGGAVGAYVHNGGIGAVVALEGGDAQLGKDLAMHIAAVAPMVVNKEDVPQDVLEREKDVIRSQPDMEGKSEEIVEKMLDGRLNKYLKEVSLVEQPFVKDPDTSVGQLVSDQGARILSFERLVVGEGIEKEDQDFASEVMAQAKG
jgi:elongation factor Ts